MRMKNITTALQNDLVLSYKRYKIVLQMTSEYISTYHLTILKYFSKRDGSIYSQNKFNKDIPRSFIHHSQNLSTAQEFING